MHARTAALLLAFPLAIPAQETTDDGYAQIERLTRAIELVRQNYVNGDDVTYEKLVNAALEGMLEGLDPHCQFLHPEAITDIRDSADPIGTNDAVGLTLTLKAGQLTALTVREDGAAAAAGILPGDILLTISGRTTSDLGTAEAIRLLDGAPGSQLQIDARRPTTGEVFQFAVTRQVAHTVTIKDPLLLHDAPEIGYIRLTEFESDTVPALQNALDKLEAEGMKALVLDLRNNPGGYLHTAVAVLGEFLPPETLVLTTEGRVPSQNPPPYRTAADSKNRDYPIAVLVNHGSASASEIVAAALQDLKRAVVIGETTFGKGSVQTILPLGDGSGSGVRLTTAKYYTPAKKVIHENGVAPDIIATLTPADEKTLLRFHTKNALRDSTPEELAGLPDRQLTRAADVLKGLLAMDAKESE